MLISLIGSSIQNVAQSWLVFQLTNSVFLLGLAGFLGAIPIFFFSLFGGAAADRWDKRNILLWTQNAFMLLAFIPAVLTQLKSITVFQIMTIALLNGIVMAFDAPARQAIIAELAGKQYLLNAIALNSAAFNAARIIGPAFAAIFIAGIGMSGCFYINGISFIAVIIALLLIHNNNGVKKSNNGTALTGDLSEGLRFIKNNRRIMILIINCGVISLFGIPYLVLMPVFANDILKVGVKGLGTLVSSAGIGALSAALMLAHFGNTKKNNRIMFFSFITFSGALIIFSLSKQYLLSLVVLLIMGWASVTGVSLVNNSLQVLVPDEFRGRVMSVFMFTFAGIMPFGNLIAGALSEIWGVSLTVMLCGVICMSFFITISVLFPKYTRDII